TSWQVGRERNTLIRQPRVVGADAAALAGEMDAQVDGVTPSSGPRLIAGITDAYSIGLALIGRPARWRIGDTKRCIPGRSNKGAVRTGSSVAICVGAARLEVVDGVVAKPRKGNRVIACVRRIDDSAAIGGRRSVIDLAACGMI